MGPPLYQNSSRLMSTRPEFRDVNLWPPAGAAFRKLLLVGSKFCVRRVAYFKQFTSVFVNPGDAITLLV